MAGTLRANAVQLGDSGTATQNFVWQTNVDGTARLSRGVVGATTQDIMVIAATGKVTFLKSVVDPGTIFAFGGVTAPTGSLVCPIAPTTVNRVTYADLFAAIGTTWGVGDGSTTFGIPWFPADYALVQGNGNVGSATVGQNLYHVHGQDSNTFILGGPTALTGSNPSTGTSGGTTAGSGGAANLAAGQRVLICVKF